MRTRKVAHVTGISPFAQAFFLCKLGYGWAAVQAFFGPAMKEPPPSPSEYTYWNEAPLKMEDPKLPGPGTAGGSGGATQSTQSTGSPTAPPQMQVAQRRLRR